MHSILNLLLDRPKAWQYGLQDPATTIAEKMIEFHDYINLHIIYIGIIFIYFLYVIILTFNKDSYPKHWIKQFTHNNVLKIRWTIILTFMLIIIFMAINYENTLYFLNSVDLCNITYCDDIENSNLTHNSKEGNNTGIKNNNPITKHYRNPLLDDMIKKKIEDARLQQQIDERIVLQLILHLVVGSGVYYFTGDLKLARTTALMVDIGMICGYITSWYFG